MPLDRQFYFFMAAAGILAGLVLARSPEARDFAVKPVFWILIAVAGFDLFSYLRGHAATGGMLKGRRAGWPDHRLLHFRMNEVQSPSRLQCSFVRKLWRGADCLR